MPNTCRMQRLTSNLILTEIWLGSLWQGKDLVALCQLWHSAHWSPSSNLSLTVTRVCIIGISDKLAGVTIKYKVMQAFIFIDISFWMTGCTDDLLNGCDQHEIPRNATLMRCQCDSDLCNPIKKVPLCYETQSNTTVRRQKINKKPPSREEIVTVREESSSSSKPTLSDSASNNTHYSIYPLFFLILFVKLTVM